MRYLSRCARAFVGLLLVCCSCGFAAVAAADDELGFEISLPQEIASEDSAILSLALENRSERDLYVNARFAVAPAGEIRVQIASESGPVPFLYRIRLRNLLPSDFLLLRPGERVVAGYRLTGGFGLEAAGRYQVDARYVNQTRPPELASGEVFVGEVQAPTVTLVRR